MKSKRLLFLMMILLLVMTFCLSLTVGSYSLSLSEIGCLLVGQSNDMMAQQVFFNLRIPRIVMGVLAGLVLGIAGGVYQLIFRNPLASPDLTGVASGASFGAALMIVIGANSAIEMMFGAFVMGIVSLFFVMFLVKMTGVQRTTTYILAGIVISALADAGIMIFKYMADPISELATIEFWTMGSLASMTLSKMLIALISIVIPLAFLLLCHRQIVMLSLGDENARYLGLNASALRIIVLLLTTWMVASIVSITGVISFVGLIAPHIAYLILHRRTKYFLLMSGFIGAFIIMVGDMLSRSLVPGAELPLSILTIFFAVPVLIFLMWKQRGQIL